MYGVHNTQNEIYTIRQVKDVGIVMDFTEIKPPNLSTLPNKTYPILESNTEKFLKNQCICPAKQ